MTISPLFRVLSLLSKNNNLLMIPSNVWPCTNINKPKFLHRYVTVAETFFTSLQNQQDRRLSGQQPVIPGQSTPKHDNHLERFWPQYFRVLFINYLEKGNVINREYFFSVITAFEGRHCKETAKEKNLFHQDNAPCTSR